jgi:uncharacterized protein (TIGR02453 family)
MLRAHLYDCGDFAGRLREYHGIRKSRRVPRLAMAVVFADGVGGRDAIAQNSPQLFNHIRNHNGKMFTPKTLSFLRSLKRNNKREWFHERRDQYEEHCRQPMTDIVERLAGDFRSFAPEMLADPKVSLFRQFRDTRFSDDKTPMKTHVAAVFPNRMLGRMNGAGMYFEVAPGWVWIGGGLWRPDTSQLQLVREHIVDNLREFDKIVKSPRLKKIGGLQGDTLSRVPRGFAKDHPAAAYLQHRQFIAFRESRRRFATKKDFYKQLRSTLETIMPLVRFLNEPLVASLKRNGARTSSKTSCGRTEVRPYRRPLRTRSRREIVQHGSGRQRGDSGDELRTRGAGEDAERNDRRENRNHRAARHGEFRGRDGLQRIRQMSADLRGNFTIALAQHQRRDAHGQVHHQPRDRAHRGQGGKGSGQCEDQRHAGAEQDRIRRRAVVRVDVAEPARQVAVFGEREDRARAVEQLAHVVPGHRQHRADRDHRGAAGAEKNSRAVAIGVPRRGHFRQQARSRPATSATSPPKR